MFDVLKHLGPINALKGQLHAMRARQKNAYLRNCNGVLHVGANAGQERELYAHFRLPVVWIEAMPSTFEELKANISPYDNQTAIQALVTDHDGGSVTFHVANNGGQSSSILALKHHKAIWPDVQFVEQIELRTSTLPSALAANGIDILRYDVLVMDTQGSELLVLQGMGDHLKRLKFIQSEAADFESYENCATVASLTSFLEERGFRLVRRNRFARHPTVGAYYDLLFENTAGAIDVRH